MLLSKEINMKKRTKVILGVIIGVLVAYSVIATIAASGFVKERDKLATELETQKGYYDNLEERYNAIYDAYMKLVLGK